MNRYLYPTPVQIDMVCTWANDGTAGLQQFMEDRWNSPGVRPDRPRTELMSVIKDLIERLGLPREYENLRQRVYQQPLHALNPGLLHQFVATLRMSGYIHRSDTRGWVRTPLTGRQLHTLRLLHGGMTRPDTARVLGNEGEATMGEYLTKLRSDMGCDTLDQALMAALDRGWLPTHRERARMRTAQAHHKPKGYPHAVVTVEAAEL